MSTKWKTSVGAGVPVVLLGADGGAGGVGARYKLDEAALRRVLLRQDVLDMPVVVVSVAGDFRGGKSFILDFFLRYLTAPRASQLNGEWLGEEDEQLKGFHWRGGCEPDTAGIHLWPEPIITTLDSGEKVAVLLMDTQGTFDPESTVGQNCTIFALSTLISSVQIYNLSRNIKANDLQHLQLFTEYGKLACEAKSKAFQTLLFLVRDWTSTRDHAYGFDGGAAFLSKRLQTNPNQNAELREVRQNINSSFEHIKCFLMPHPGQIVDDESFSGCIRDLSKDFRTKLRELVPSLFDPGHLTPKLINGERVLTQDLYEYFKKYVEIYNSDEVPEATTIFRATVDACLLVAARAACDVYAARMNERVVGARSLAKRALHAAHDDARAHAERAFANKRKLGSQEEADAKLADLLKELDESLSRYLLANEAKVRETISLAKRTYDAAVSKLCGKQTHMCLHPRALEELHDKASLDALTLFDAARDVPEHNEDDQRLELQQNLRQAYEHLCVINDQNNKRAMQDARELYVKRMKTELDAAGGGVRADELRAQHKRALGDVRALLEKQRNGPLDHDDDPYLNQLLQELDGILLQYILDNEAKVREMVPVAKEKYAKVVNKVCGEHMRLCLHPNALESLDQLASLAALKQFYTGKDDQKLKLDQEKYAEIMKKVSREHKRFYMSTSGPEPEYDEGDEDDQKLELEQSLRQMYENLRVINHQNNTRAVQGARELYMTRMSAKLDASDGADKRDAQHERALADAREFLKQQRNPFSAHSTIHHKDPYQDQLLQEIDSCFEEFARAHKKYNSKMKEERASIKLLEKTYNDHISSKWDPPKCCFHPRALLDLHEEALEAALKACLNKDYEYKKEVTETLEERFSALVSVNELYNERAVEEAVCLYKTKMADTKQPQKSFLSNLLNPQDNSKATYQSQVNCKHAAIKLFMKRRLGAVHLDDTYYEDLIEALEAASSE